MMPAAGGCSVFVASEASPFGPVAAVWGLADGRPQVRRVFITRPGAVASRSARLAFPDAEERSCAAVDGMLGQIRAFLLGGDVAFSLEIVSLENCAAFQRAVLLAEREIPRGYVSSYGAIARALGVPRAARAVGRALARNPFPILIPCHRAVRSDGSLGGYQGGQEMKRALLALEGVTVTRAGHLGAEALWHGI